MQINLAMLWQGARGKTSAELQLGLCFTENPLTTAGRIHTLIEPLQNTSSVVKMANKIYVAKNFVVNPKFNEILSLKFNATAESIDFIQNQIAATAINRWVERQTNNLIRDLISPDILDEFTRMVLVNAIYFNAVWQTPFKKQNTFLVPFFTDDNVSRKIETMHLTVNF